MQALREDIEKNPDLICALLPLEEELQRNWQFKAGNKGLAEQPTQPGSAADVKKDDVTQVVTNVSSTVTKSEKVVMKDGSIEEHVSKASTEWSMGALFRELI